MQQQQAQAATPQINRRYRVQTELGRGGMGVVFRVTDRLTNQTVALKQVLVSADDLTIGSHGGGVAYTSGETTDAQRISLAQEFRTLASLRHPNIISVLDYGFDELRQPYFTMDFLANALPISEAVLEEPLSGRMARVLEMLQALSYLHRRGIVHRDLKPGNVLVAGEQVRVLDFGLATAWDREDADEEIVGTLGYMAPEVLSGQRPTRSADLYAVGVMLYEIICGGHPFHLEDMNRLIYDILSGSPNLLRLQEALTRDTLPPAPDAAADMPTMIGTEPGVLPRAADEDNIRTIIKGKPLPLEALEAEPDDETRPGEASGSTPQKVTPPAADRTEMLEGKLSAIDITFTTPLDIEGEDGAVPEDGTMAELSPVAQIVARLMRKDPAERYQSADEVIRDLCLALDRPVPEESAAIRESFLQAARFVGRETELRRLTLALQTAFEGQGSTWLIAGENGIGKSRLLEELRIRALVQGVLVLRGRGVAGGGVPYQVWREPLRRLLLNADISDLDASILKDLVPDIAGLLERDIPDAPLIDSNDYQQRLVGAITTLFQRQTQPMALLVEDLQWAEESLVVLRALNEVVTRMPLLIIGSYRQEDKPDLPDELPEMTLMRLERLSKDSITALSESMLGSAGRQQDLLDLLQRETEGNAFFLVEVVRALAEEAGRLEDIGRITLPEHVVTGGVRAVIQRRLEQVPPEYRRLLHLAAVVGREPALQVLEQVRGSVNLDSWLTVCANCAVLEIQDGRWQFTHDKLRQEALAQIAPSALPAYHREIAQTIEAVYPDNDDQAAILMQHWRAAGDAVKEFTYARRAGELALRTSVYDEALVCFERALELLSEAEDSPRTRLLRADLLTQLGTALQYRGEYVEAEVRLSGALRLYRAEKAAEGLMTALGLLAEVAERQGEYADADDYAAESLTTARALNDARGIARALNRLGMVRHEQGDFDAARRYFEESLTHAEASGEPLERVAAINNLGLVAYGQDDLSGALARFEQVLDVVRASGDRRKSAAILLNLGGVSASMGAMAKAKGYFEESLTICREIGERRLIALILDNLGIAALESSDFAAAQQHFEEGLELARAINNRQGAANTLVNLGDLKLAQGNTAEAANDYREALEIAHEIEALPTLMNALAGIAELESDPQTALQWFGLVLHHPATLAWRRGMVEAVIKQRSAGLPDAEREALLETGKVLSLEAVIAQIL